MSKKKQSINYLDLIPQRAETLRWHTDEATGLITLEVENTGVFNTIAQKVFHKPRTTQVHLDETGSYLWPLIDGQKTVAQLADCMKQQFPDIDLITQGTDWSGNKAADVVSTTLAQKPDLDAIFLADVPAITERPAYRPF